LNYWQTIRETTNAPKTGDEPLPNLDIGTFIVYQIAVKYYPGVCGIDTQQFGCSVSTDN